MLHTAEQLVKKYEILASPSLKPGRNLLPEVAYTVEKFNCNDSVGRVMPGKNNYEAVKTGGTEKHKLKGPVLKNLSEVYTEFKVTSCSQDWIL
jgi:hypothetical protein